MAHAGESCKGLGSVTLKINNQHILGCKNTRDRTPDGVGGDSEAQACRGRGGGAATILLSHHRRAADDSLAAKKPQASNFVRLKIERVKGHLSAADQFRRVSYIPEHG